MKYIIPAVALFILGPIILVLTPLICVFVYEGVEAFLAYVGFSGWQDACEMTSIIAGMVCVACGVASIAGAGYLLVDRKYANA